MPGAHLPHFCTDRRDHVVPPQEHLDMVEGLLAQQAASRVSDADAATCLLYTSPSPRDRG